MTEPGAPSPSPADPAERAAKRGARIASALFLALSVLFVLSSTWQICRAVLFDHDAPAPPPSGQAQAAAPRGR
jgi:hypothetical protein